MNNAVRKSPPAHRAFEPEPVRLTPVDEHGGSARITPLREADAKRFADTPSRDPSLVAPVIASPEDILRAQELRRQIKKKYLNQSEQADSYWSIGVD